MTESDLWARLRHVDSTSLADADKSLRVLPPEIRLVAPGRRLLGRAVTADAGGDLMSVIAALHEAGTGDVIVVSAGVPDRAMAGELFATEALRRGVAGIVIDGLSRDTATLATLDLPVFSRGTCPHAVPARAVPVTGVPLVIGSVTVHPGDVLLGDDDGIVVGTEAELAAAIDAAERIQASEQALQRAIAAGESLFDHLDFVRHRAALEAGETSTLAFS